MKKSKKTLVLGASENPDRYSNKAIRQLRSHGHSVVAVGKKKGQVEDVSIVTTTDQVKDIDTVTLYLNPLHQKQYYDLIMNLRPRRIIFNPGAENPELKKLVQKNGIEPVEGCTLVMLSMEQF